jgi:hypothetical protein
VNHFNLEFLVRTTAIRATKFVQFAKNTYKRPASVRMQNIEDICNRNLAEKEALASILSW